MTETAAHNGGNIINGFEGYLKNTNANRRKYDVADSERLFSNSSLTYPKVRLAYLRGACALWILFQ